MKKLLLTAIGLASVATICHAGTILSETFSYPDGDLKVVSGGVWYPHGNISTTPLYCTNGQAVVIGASSYEDDSADLAGGPYETNSPAVLYSSYSLIISNQAGLPTLAGGYISHFKICTSVRPLPGFLSTRACGSASQT